MQKLAEICVRRPVFATMLILTLVVLGIFSYNRLVVERFPRVEFPTITITTRLPGAAPQEVETEITDKIEEAVNTISGIDELRSTSAEGVSLVFISFDLERNLDSAAQDVRDKINRALPNLPRTSNNRQSKSHPDARRDVSELQSQHPVTEFPTRCFGGRSNRSARRRLQIIGGQNAGERLSDGTSCGLQPDRHASVGGPSSAKPEVPGGRVEQADRAFHCPARSAAANLRAPTTSSSPAATDPIKISDIGHTEDGR
jgi:HAE1 family hydrophobic/amphiphilic exporter-1